MQGFGLSLPMIKIDGGLSTALEELGADLKSILWTGDLIDKNPERIIAAHRAYIDAGAKFVISSSYQVSYIGEDKTGKSDDEITKLLEKSTELAQIAKGKTDTKIAASIGPYGAALGDGSEYRGNYLISNEELKEFHRRRIEVLARTEPDLFAVETIPSVREAKIVEDLINKINIPYWVSFSCKDESHISEGDTFEDAILSLEKSPNRLAVGINCTDPRFISPLLRSVRSRESFVIYPNAGRVWDAESKIWVGEKLGMNKYLKDWSDLGVSYLGGCCGIGTSEIAALEI